MCAIDLLCFSYLEIFLHFLLGSPFQNLILFKGVIVIIRDLCPQAGPSLNFFFFECKRKRKRKQIICIFSPCLILVLHINRSCKLIKRSKKQERPFKKGEREGGREGSCGICGFIFLLKRSRVDIYGSPSKFLW